MYHGLSPLGQHREEKRGEVRSGGESREKTRGGKRGSAGRTRGARRRGDMKKEDKRRRDESRTRDVEEY